MGNKKIVKMMKLNILFLVLAHFTIVGAQLDDFCNSTDLNYQCNEPEPQDPSIRNKIFCNPVENFFYDPSNCDAGYWCGCKVRDKTKCIPKLNSKYWSGYFTTNTTNTIPPKKSSFIHRTILIKINQSVFQECIAQVKKAPPFALIAVLLGKSVKLLPQ